MKQIQHPKTPLFRAAIALTVLLFLGSFGHASSKKTFLEGEDTEEQVQYALDTSKGYVTSDLSRFKEAREGEMGKKNIELFEEAKEIFVDMATRRNAMIEAMHLMCKEDGGNETAVTRLLAVNLSDLKGYPYEFQPDLKWGTILMKLEMLPNAFTGLEEHLEDAFKKHKVRKVKRLQDAYSALAVQALRTNDAFESINDLYPKPDKLEPEDVSGDDLDTLKAKIPDFEEAVAAYDMALLEAKKWQRTFDSHLRKHVSLTAAQEKLAAAFEVLKKANGDNPKVKDVDDLPDISGEGDLATLKGILDDIVKAQNVLAGSLAQAKTWQKAVDMHYKKYVLLTAEQEKLEAAFEVLRQNNDQNPHLKGVDDLPEIAGEGDLATIKGTLDDIAKDQGLLSEALVLAKAWKPEEL